MSSASMAYNIHIFPCHFFRNVMQSTESSKNTCNTRGNVTKKFSAPSYIEKVKTNEKRDLKYPQQETHLLGNF